LTLSASARYAAVFLGKTKQTVAIDVTARESPRLIGRTAPVSAHAPYVSSSPEGDWIMMPAASEDETIGIDLPGSAAATAARDGTSAAPRADYVISTRQQESALEVIQTAPRHILGRFPLFGPLNLGRTRPTGLAYSPKRGLLAVATRSGTLHLVELRSRVGAPEPAPGRMATTREGALRR
jgi:glycerol-3-phosphate acyltransferase PlsY